MKKKVTISLPKTTLRSEGNNNDKSGALFDKTNTTVVLIKKAVGKVANYRGTC